MALIQLKTVVTFHSICDMCSSKRGCEWKFTSTVS